VPVRTWRSPVAAFTAVLLLAGCSAGGTAASSPMVLVVAGRQLDFVQELTNGFGAGVDKVGGVVYQVAGPQVVDSAAEWDTLQAYRDGRHGSVSLFTLAPELFADTLGQAAAAGTPLIALHSTPAPGSGVRLFIGNDNVKLGTMLGRAVARHLPAGSTGLVVLGASSPGVQVLDDRIDGVRRELKKSRPGLRIIGPFDTKLDPDANLQAWRTLQAANPHAVAFVGVGGADAHNLAVLHGARPGRVDGGVGADPAALAAAKTGTMVLASTEPYLQGELAGALQAQHARTGRALPEGWLVVPALLIDTTDADRIIARQASAESRSAWFQPQAEAMLRDPGHYLEPLDDAG
jgi:ABC-type sugar transport system substrate-binding protein